MRQAFINTLVECAEKDERIYLLVADTRLGLTNPFADKFPDRFVNVGVAEQNMIGIATGLALSGKIVFAYSIGNFPTLRCLEQIRNDVCYHKANVNIVAGSTGLSYAALGSSHHALEDIAVMRAMPNMTVIAPGDSVETALATKAIAKGVGACYLRLGIAPKVDAHKILPEFKIGKAISVLGGRIDVMLISTGTMLNVALQVAKKLGKEFIKAGVLSMHTVKPLDVEAVVNASMKADAVVTIEEHSIVGGLGNAVAEVLADKGISVKFKRMGIKDVFCIQVGNQEELLEIYGLSVGDIVKEVCKLQ